MTDLAASAPPVPGERAPLLRAAPVILGLAAAGVRLWFLQRTGILYEDALISLRYAENLAAGYGLTYNPGERPVFGASTPLYVLWLAALMAVGLPGLLLSRIGGGICDGLTLFLWCRRFLRERRPAAAALFSAGFGLNAAVVPVSVSGMETSYALLVFTLAVQAAMDGRRRAAGVAAGLLALLRPEGVLIGSLLAVRLWLQERRFPWPTVVFAAIVVLPWVVGATIHFGTPVPNSIPAKIAAYNLHRTSSLPNLLDTLGNLAPFREPWGRMLFNLPLAVGLVSGAAVAARGDAAARLFGALFLAWWAVLVVPRTLLFLWYHPPLLLPALLLSACGWQMLWERLASPPRRRVALAGALAAIVVGGAGWLGWSAGRTAKIQRAEEGVRRRIGLWLRERTPAGAQVAAEPIGYIGYYSRRRILDEVGLVSPEMIAVNRPGAGWFDRMLASQRPEYIVERPGYLLRDHTINSRIPMFERPGGLERFLRLYAPAARCGTLDVPRHLALDYSFVVYRRRTYREAQAWEAALQDVPPEERAAWLEAQVRGQFPGVEPIGRG